MPKFKRMRRYARSASRFVRRSSRRSMGGRLGGIIHLDAMAYGAVRNPIANAIMSKTGTFAGQYTDEIIMGGLAVLLGKSGMLRGVASKALIVENASVGATLASGLNIGAGSTASSVTMYG